MKDIAVVAYCRTGIARATRGALNQTHGTEPVLGATWLRALSRYRPLADHVNAS